MIIQNFPFESKRIKKLKTDLEIFKVFNRNKYLYYRVDTQCTKQYEEKKIRTIREIYITDVYM